MQYNNASVILVFFNTFFRCSYVRIRLEIGILEYWSIKFTKFEICSLSFDWLHSNSISISTLIRALIMHCIMQTEQSCCCDMQFVKWYFLYSVLSLSFYSFASDYDSFSYSRPHCCNRNVERNV